MVTERSSHGAGHSATGQRGRSSSPRSVWRRLWDSQYSPAGALLLLAVGFALAALIKLCCYLVV